MFARKVMITLVICYRYFITNSFERSSFYFLKNPFQNYLLVALRLENNNSGKLKFISLKELTHATILGYLYLCESHLSFVTVSPYSGALS